MVGRSIVPLSKDAEARVEAVIKLLKFNVRGLSNNNVEIIKDKIGKHVAYTDGRDIYLSETVLLEFANGIKTFPATLGRTIAKLKGLTYHELAHIMWTISTSSLFRKTIINRKHDMAWNILEDQRIEAFLVTKYRHQKYLVPTVHDIALNITGDSSWAVKAHVLTHGRRYLSDKVRNLARVAWVGGLSEADEIANIIDEYLMIVHDRDNVKALVLVEMFYNLIKQHFSGCGMDDHSWQRTSENKLKVIKRNEENSELSEEIKKQLEEEAQSGNKQENSRDQQDNSDEDSQADDKGGSDSSNVAQELSDALEAEVQDAIDGLEAAGEIESTIEQYGKFLNTRGNFDAHKVSDAQMFSVPQQIKIVPAKIAHELKQITSRFGSQVTRKQYDGDLNVLDYRTRKPGQPLKVFDKYQREQKWEAALEVAVLIDRSGSTCGNAMSKPFRGCTGIIADVSCLSAWCVKGAIDSLPNSECTVITFDTAYNHELLYDRHKRVNKDRYVSCFPRGGTAPYSAINESVKLFDETSAKHKMLIIITDGIWTNVNSRDTKNAENIIASLNSSGVMTVLFGVGGYGKVGSNAGPVAMYGSHNCRVAQDLTDILELPKIVGKVARDQLFRSARTNRRI